MTPSYQGERGAEALKERAAYLHMDNYAGHSKELVIVVGETKTRYRIAAPDGVARIRLAGMYRYLVPGKTALVPKAAVSFVKAGK
jgi:hypothetical protein